MFEDQKVRMIWIESEEKWYFSIKDVVKRLVEANVPEKRCPGGYGFPAILWVIVRDNGAEKAALSQAICPGAYQKPGWAGQRLSGYTISSRQGWQRGLTGSPLISFHPPHCRTTAAGRKSIMSQL